MISFRNIVPFISLLIITIMPFRGNMESNDQTENYYVAGSSFYSTFTPENIDGFFHQQKFRKHRRRDTIKMISDIPDRNVKIFVDSLCKSAGVPTELVKEIGENESKWQFIRQRRGGNGKGDLQVIDNTFIHWYKRLSLKGGHTRSNYLIVAVHYLKHCYNQEKSWKKARFVYARGHWRDESTWSPAERAFMNKIDWSKYDRE